MKDLIVLNVIIILQSIITEVHEANCQCFRKSVNHQSFKFLSAKENFTAPFNFAMKVMDPIRIISYKLSFQRKIGGNLLDPLQGSKC